MTPFNRLLDKLRTYTKENTSIEEFLKVMRAIGALAEIFCQNEPVYSFLLGVISEEEFRAAIHRLK